MSFDALIAAHTEALSTNTASLMVVADLLRQTNEGREAVLAELRADTAQVREKPARALRKGEPKVETSYKSQPKAKPDASAPQSKATKLPTADDVRKVLGDWVSETDDAAQRDVRKAFLKSITEHFGARPAELEPEKMQQVLFFVARHKAGLPVDFRSDYDFSGDPAQGAIEPVQEDLFG